jgi:hypothetical protein
MTKLLLVVAAIGMLGMGACSKPSIDERANELIDRLGPMCQNFDFQTKQPVGDGEVRPVYCSEVDDDAEHPHFTLFVFSGSEVQEQWLQLPGAMGGRYHFNGTDWSVMSDDDILDRVRDRLVGG